MSAVSMQNKARDISFNFADSCNCCCMGGGKKEADDRTVVFVRRDGTLEQFNPKKAGDTLEAAQLTLQRLKDRVEGATADSPRPSQDIVRLVERETGVSLRHRTTPSLVTLGTVKKIESVVNRVRREGSASTSPLPPGMPAPLEIDSSTRAPVTFHERPESKEQ